MTCVDWFNQRRLYGEITVDAGYTTPAGHKAAYYLQNTRPSSRSPQSLYRTRGDSAGLSA